MLSSFARFYFDGGFFMHPILLAGLAGMGIVAVQFGTMRTKFNATPLALGLLANLVVLGVLGSMMGFMQLLQALANAAPDMKHQLMAAGSAMSLNTAALSLMFVAMLIPPMSVATALRSGFAGTKSPAQAATQPAAPTVHPG